MIDGLFTCKRIRIKDTKSLTIIPVGDIHRDSENCSIKKWKEFLSYEKKRLRTDGDRYYLFMGDTHDFASFSERRSLKASRLHEQTRELFDATARKMVREFVMEIEFMRGHILGFLEGNHTWEYLDTTTTTDDIAERMGTNSLGSVCYLRLSFNYHGSYFNIDIMANHGKGGGRLPGSTFNSIDKMVKICPGADLYYMGHDHKRGSIPQTILVPAISGGKLTMKQFEYHLGRTGSFLRGYVPGKGTYVSKALLQPASLGVIRHKISIARKRMGKGMGEDRLYIKQIESIV